LTGRVGRQNVNFNYSVGKAKFEKFFISFPNFCVFSPEIVKN